MPRVRQPLTEDRKAKFLEVLRISGSVSHACRAASGIRQRDDSSRCPYGYKTYHDERKRNPEFARSWDEALKHFAGELEAEVARRCFLPDTRPLVTKDGNPIRDESGKIICAESWMAANALALRTLSKLDPSWIDKRNLQGNIQIEHTHDLKKRDGLYIETDSIRQLSDEKQTLLFQLLDEMENAKKALPAPATENFIEGEIADAK